MTKKILTTLAFGLAVTLPSFATPLAPGATAPPDIFATGIGAGSVLLATNSGALTFGTPPPATFSGTYTTSVYRDPVANLACPTGGCLDFVYMVTNNGPSVVESITASAFDSFITDVGYQPGTGVLPTTVGRSGFGTSGPVITWNFPGAVEINAGQSSDLLIIETNALNYTTGTLSAQDGTAGNGVGFQPTTVPEPMSMGLLGGGLALLGIARWRKTGKKS